MSRNDPLLNHNFLISLIDTSSLLSVIGTIASKVLDSAVGGFSECTGIEMAMAPEEYKEGGRNGGLLKFPTRVTWSNLILKRGLANSTELWDWHYGFAIGEGTRRDGMITLLDEQRSTRCIWYFTRGLPIKYSGPALNATQNNVAIETIEIAHEGLYQVGGLGTISGAIGAIAGLVG